jgi:hypothetical protein
VAGPRQDDDAHVVVRRERRERAGELADRRVVERVVLLRAVERQARDATPIHVGAYSLAHRYILNTP